MSDGRGLLLRITPTGGKLWRWKYRTAEGVQKDQGNLYYFRIVHHPGITQEKRVFRYQSVPLPKADFSEVWSQLPDSRFIKPAKPVWEILEPGRYALVKQRAPIASFTYADVVLF